MGNSNKLVTLAATCFVSIVLLSGCEAANDGAKNVGKTAGKVLRVPNSAQEGITDGMKGPDGPNPYKR
tara:strand:- start:2594 stop:2797 length:204 start_codon:yes stop_codon:yes gene_type:complete